MSGTAAGIAATIMVRLGMLPHKLFLIFYRYDGVSAKVQSGTRLLSGLHGEARQSWHHVDKPYSPCCQRRDSSGEDILREYIYVFLL